MVRQRILVIALFASLLLPLLIFGPQQTRAKRKCSREYGVLFRQA